jgi:hypothetical protein
LLTRIGALNDGDSALARIALEIQGKKDDRVLDRLIKYYENNVTSYSLVYKHMKISYYSFITSYVIALFSTFALLIGMFIYFLVPTFLYFSGDLFIIVLLLFLISFFVLNKRAKQILFKKYKLTVKKILWVSAEFEEIKHERLRNYLVLNGLYNESKINLMIEMLNKDIEREKLPSIIAPGIVLSFIVPVWIQFLTFIFKPISTTEEAISAIIFLFLFVLVMAVVFGIWKHIDSNLKENLFFTRLALKKNLILRLEDALLRFDPNAIRQL